MLTLCLDKSFSALKVLTTIALHASMRSCNKQLYSYQNWYPLLTEQYYYYNGYHIPKWRAPSTLTLLSVKSRALKEMVEPRA